ncbi:hypothetical protein D9M71_227850 [compost metagenome]
MATAVDNGYHIRFRRLEALHVRVHGDRSELPLKRGLDPIHRKVGSGGGDVGVVDLPYQQALAEAGAGIGLVIL